ncbi:MAG: hypothetical protein FWB77_04530 [Treponema sp.]|nr:hypothetical protein [Treponema sp.]
MKALIIGLIMIAAAVFAILPADVAGFGLGWGDDVLTFLKGAAPVLAILFGIIAVFIGIADMKDRAEARKEDAQAEEKAASN